MGLFGKKKGLVGVDIGSSAVKAVELKVGGKGGDEYQLLNIGIESLPAVNHQPQFAAAAASAAADRAVLDAATALALTVVDVASDSHERERLLARSVRESDA